MTTSRRLRECAEFDVTVDTAAEELEAAMEAIPMLIFILRLAQAQARRELSEAEAVDLALMGSQHMEEAVIR